MDRESIFFFHTKMFGVDDRLVLYPEKVLLAFVMTCVIKIFYSLEKI